MSSTKEALQPDAGEWVVPPLPFDAAVSEYVQAAAEGDAEAWAALVDRFADPVWSVTRAFRLGREDAADVSQTTWMRLAEHINRLRDPGALGGWLVTTARRECLAVLRHHQRQVAVADLNQERPDRDEGELPGGALLLREQADELWSAFTCLPPASQLLLRLLFADPPLSYREIAAATGIRIGSIGPSRARCLARLRERVSASNGNPRNGNRPANDEGTDVQGGHMSTEPD